MNTFISCTAIESTDAIIRHCNEARKSEDIICSDPDMMIKIEKLKFVFRKKT